MKKDVFGQTELIEDGTIPRVRRDSRSASTWAAWLARRLLAAEGRALAVAGDLEGVPELLFVDERTLEREFIAGVPMQEGRPDDVDYFLQAAKLLRQLHRRGIAHNDLAKEPNFLVTIDGRPALVDFQLALYSPRRGRLFRVLAREDIRHLLKHKRTYCHRALTARERRILATPAWPTRIWMKTGKPVYLFITRRLMGWQDREGAGDRV